ncbi:MAG: efflux RND transporter periplasmic adaptor subunit [Cyanobacteria bacterium J06621_8]
MSTNHNPNSEPTSNLETNLELLDDLDSNETSEVTITEPTKSTSKKKNWLPILGAAVVLIGGVAIWRSNSQSEQPVIETTENVEQARLSVKTVTATDEPIQAWSYGDGTVSAIVKKHLTFQAEGTIDYIKKIDGRDLREGDRVNQGELLAKVDRRKFDADITVATAAQTEARNQVASSFATLRQAEESLVQTQADLEQAKTDSAFAQVDLQRYQELLSQGAIERRQVEVKETEYKNSLAALQAAEAGVGSAKAQVVAAKTQVESAQAGVDSANAQLSRSNVDSEDTELIAPFDGVISRLNIREGEYWNPQIVSLSGDYQGIVDRLPIIMIDPNQFEVYVDLPAFQGAQIEIGQKALIILDQDSSQANSSNMTGQDLENLARAKGRVFSVSPSVSPGERSVRVTIRIDEGAANLQDGEQISAWIATEEKTQATVAPFSAFVSRDRQFYVFVVDEASGVVEQRAIQPGIEGLAKREIIEGVKPGEKLVTDGKNRLVNGAPVEIIP